MTTKRRRPHILILQEPIDLIPPPGRKLDFLPSLLNPLGVRFQFLHENLNLIP